MVTVTSPVEIIRLVVPLSATSIHLGPTSVTCCLSFFVQIYFGQTTQDLTRIHFQVPREVPLIDLDPLAEYRVEA